MSGRLFHDNRRTVEFPITAGLKQGCVLTPALLSLYLAAMLHDILPENPGINMQYRFDADIFNTGDSPFPSELPSLNLNRGVNSKKKGGARKRRLGVPCSPLTLSCPYCPRKFWNFASELIWKWCGVETSLFEFTDPHEKGSDEPPNSNEETSLPESPNNEQVDSFSDSGSEEAVDSALETKMSTIRSTKIGRVRTETSLMADFLLPGMKSQEDLALVAINVLTYLQVFDYQFNHDSHSFSYSHVVTLDIKRYQFRMRLICISYCCIQWPLHTINKMNRQLDSCKP